MTAYQRPPTSFAPVTPARLVEPEQVTYDFSWLDAQGADKWKTLTLPAHDVIEGAVTLFARGTPIDTPRGQSAVEDLLPGDRVLTPEGSATVRWVGSRCFPATAPIRPTLFRIGSSAFGRDRPVGDVVLGGSARILIQSDRCRTLVGQDAAFAPIAAFEDALGVIALMPPGDVTTYGIACDGQAAVMIDGMAVEAWHPARDMMRRVTPAMLDALRQLIPPLAEDGFGSARIPYLSDVEAQTLRLL
ncbi:Hint domain-containing protein [Jannaschia aquimarina]|nr:Hint domain-containing protein [Jannaschia aquimarina]